MTTLVIHAPTWRHRTDSAKSFQQTISSRMGEGYALLASEVESLARGCDVIVLDKGGKRRANATLNHLEPTGVWTANHVQRYNVYLDGVREIPFDNSASIRLNRRGIALI